jgi:sugar transferase (PEP-CTERM/EpsH1 system associated)
VRVLFLTHRLPYAPNRGDRIRAFHIVRTLAARMQVEVVSFTHDYQELAQTDRLRALGVEVTAVPLPRLRNYVNAAVGLAGRRPLTHLLLDAPGLSPTLRDIVERRRPDVVLAYCSGMARFALESPLSALPLVVDLVDVDSQKWAALSLSATVPKRWIYRREAVYLEQFERHLARRAHATTVVNERERETLERIAPGAQIRVVPNGVDLKPLSPPAPAEPGARVVFCGVMNYTPNVEAVLWFVRTVWPIVRAARPDAELSIVGSDPTPAIRRLAAAGQGIDVTGTVADVRDYLWRAAVAIAPLQTARGVQNKVLEAVAAGLPAIVTPQVFTGLPASVRPACRVADAAGAFADHTLSLLAMTPGQRRQIADSANLENLSWEHQLRPLSAILADAAATTAIAV